MKGFAYFDPVNKCLVKVNVRYPEDFEHCVERPTVFDLVHYLAKHTDEEDYLIGEHDMKNRLFRQQAYEAKQYDLAASKGFQSKPKKDRSFEAKLKEIHDAP